MADIKRDICAPDTRARILERLGLNEEIETGHEVALAIESGWSGGCETCEYWVDNMWIEVNGKTVYSFYSQTTIAEFLEFLAGSDEYGFRE